MRLLDLSFPDPESNLALDEALLDEAEAGRGHETLRIWESPVRFVVLGVSQKAGDEVYRDACMRDGVPILRRCSAGGCVLQGPGCLNFSLVLDQQHRPEINTVRGSYCYIFDRLKASFAAAGVVMLHQGISDLVVAGRKVSGNAQRRKKRFILHHGTLLYAADIGAIGTYLKEPKDRPDYRQDKSHAEFVGNIGICREELVGCLLQAFPGTTSDLAPSDDEAVLTQSLAQTKYADPAWTLRR